MQTVTKKYLANSSAVFSDLKKAARLFIDMQAARKEEKKVTIVKSATIPVFNTGISFCSTIEGCVLANCKFQGVCDIANNAFSKLPYDVKLKLSYTPQYGEFIKRAHFWKELLQPVMTPKQFHVAMIQILDWYIHVKKMRKGAPHNGKKGSYSGTR